jgi:metal-sulfur cluster biosynthetic enzyme
MSGKDSKAGQDPAAELTPAVLLAALRQVNDPDLGLNVVDLGLIYDVAIVGADVKVKMTLTSPMCPYAPYLVNQVATKLTQVPGVNQANVELVWDPPWTDERLSPEIRAELGLD